MSHSTVGTLSPRRLDNMPGIRLRRLDNPPPRNEPFNHAPGYHEPRRLVVVWQCAAAQCTTRLCFTRLWEKCTHRMRIERH